MITERASWVDVKPGDFIQTNDHFGDVYFEVVSTMPPSEGSDYWSVTYVKYDKYGSTPREAWTNSGGSGIRRVIPAEMAVPVMLVKRARFFARKGRFDPFIGFIRAGAPDARRAA